MNSHQLLLLPSKNIEFLIQPNRERHFKLPFDGHWFFSFCFFDRYRTTSLIGVPFSSADEKLKGPTVLWAFNVSSPGWRIRSGGILALPVKAFGADSVIAVGNTVVEAL